jgi:hypothetical protein
LKDKINQFQVLIITIEIIMKKNLIAGVVISLAMVGMFGGVSFAESATAAKPVVKTEVKSEAPAVAKKKVVKKHAKKKVAKKVTAKKDAAPAEAK